MADVDLSALSDADLLALKAGDLTKVSNEGLLALKGVPTKTLVQPDVPLVASQMPKQMPVAEPKRSMLDRVKALYEVPATLASGAIAQPAGAAYGVYKGVTSPQYGTQAGVEEGRQAGAELAQKLQYQPTSDRKSTRLNSSH